MRPKTIAFLLCCVCLLSGCWDLKELNQLAIVSTIGFDKQDDEVVVILQVLDPTQIAGGAGGADGGGRAPAALYTERGTSIDEVISRITTKAPYQLYTSHIRVAIIGEKLAREDGVAKVFEYLSRDQYFRADFNVVVVKKQPVNQVMSMFSPVGRIPGFKMYQSLRTSDKAWASTMQVHLDEAIRTMTAPGEQLVLTGLLIEGDPEIGTKKKLTETIRDDARLTFHGLAAFKKDKLVGWLDENESAGLKFLKNKVDQTTISIPCGLDSYASLQINRAQTDTSAHIIRGHPKFKVKVKLEGEMEEAACGIDLKDEKTIDELEKKGEERIRAIVQRMIDKEKSMSTDVIGLGNLLYRKQPAYWKAHGQDWNSMLPELEVDIQVSLDIRRIGTNQNPLIKEMEE